MIPARMTQEMKWGRYKSVWETFLNFRLLISFIISASITGMGNPIISFSRLMTTVLRRTGRNDALENSFTN